jgi:hypothetical protein
VEICIKSAQEMIGEEYYEFGVFPVWLYFRNPEHDFNSSSGRWFKAISLL